MKDLIRRSDAIKAMAKAIGRILYDAEAVSQHVMNSIPAVEPNQEWIPCSERLPEESGKSYLTYQGDSRYGWCQVLRYDDGWNCLNGDKKNEIKGVVAWMPLPDLPKGADDDTD